MLKTILAALALLFWLSGGVRAAAISPLVLVCDGVVAGFPGNVGSLTCTVPWRLVAPAALAASDQVVRCSSLGAHESNSTRSVYNPTLTYYWVQSCIRNEPQGNLSTVGGWEAARADVVHSQGVGACANSDNYSISTGFGAYYAGCGIHNSSNPLKVQNYRSLNLAFLRPDLYGLEIIHTCETCSGGGASAPVDGFTALLSESWGSAMRAYAVAYNGLNFVTGSPSCYAVGEAIKASGAMTGVYFAGPVENGDGYCTSLDSVVTATGVATTRAVTVTAAGTGETGAFTPPSPDAMGNAFASGFGLVFTIAVLSWGAMAILRAVGDKG